MENLKNIAPETANDANFGADIAALILSAGYSSRMRSFKPLLDFRGKPALAHLIDSFSKAGISDIGVVTGFNHEKLSPVINSHGAFEIYNPDFASGMFSSVLTGTAHFAERENPPSAMLVCPVDSPLISVETVKILLKEARRSSDSFIVPCFKGKKGHPLFVPRCFFGEILSHDGKMGLKGVTSKFENRLARVETGVQGVVLDMDAPEDYERMLSYFLEESAFERLDKLSAGRRFILIRHGEIIKHREKILIGQYDPGLSEEGARQIIKTAKELKTLDIKTGVIYTSDLLRARESAVIIAEELGVSRIEALSGLREISLGAWDGRFISEIKRDYPEEYRHRGENPAAYKIDADSENFYEFNYRVRKCLAKLLENDKNEDIVIVSHSGVIKAIAQPDETHNFEKAKRVSRGGFVVLNSHPK